MVAHLAICSFCNERLEMSKNERAALAKFSQQLKNQIRQPTKKTPKVGQIWNLSIKSAGWGPCNRYFNPPQVLLLHPIEGSKGFIASQLFSEKALMGHGDIWLSESFGFAEAWNIYSVHTAMLESCCGEISHSLLTDVCNAADQDWEASPEGSILKSFRQIEVSVASYFSIQASAQLTAEYEAASELTMVLDGALQKLKAFVRDLTFGDLELLGQNFAMAGVTRGGDNVDPETAAKLVHLKEDESIKLLPIDHGQFKGDRYKLKFRDITWLSKEPLPVQVTLRGALVKNTQWEHWGTDDTWLVLPNTIIGNEERRVETTFLSITWDGSVLRVDILP